jgi:hypothetical protein
MGQVVINGQWYDYGAYQWMRPNDSVSIGLYGVNSSEACESKVTINCGKISCTFVDSYLTLNGLSPQCNCNDFGTTVYGCAGSLFQGKLISYSAQNRTSNIHFLVPANFFGTGITPGHNSAGIRLEIKVTNKDGKFKTRQVTCMVYPDH